MTAPELQTLAQAFTGRMLNTAAEGMILAGLAWALRPLIRRQNSGTRFALWFLVLLAIVALPFFAGSGFGTADSLKLIPANLHREILLPASWAIYLLSAWAGGATLLLLRLSAGLWQVHRLRSECKPVELASVDPEIAAIFREFGSSSQTKLCVSRQVSAPAAIGFFRPAIVFPAWLLPQLSAAEIEVILLHENAHLCRWDQWSNLAQKFVKAVFFFHPAVWWIERRLTLEREMACDDMVLAQCASPKAYASFLITIAERLQNAQGLALVQALLSRTRQMSLRVAQILNAKRPRHTGLWKPLPGVGACLFAVVFGATPYVPPLVAFRNPTSPSPSQQIQAAKEESQPAPVAAGGNVSRIVVSTVAQRLDFVPQPRAISAAYHPRTTEVALRLKATEPRKLVGMRAITVQKELPNRETVVILQTTNYAASGSGIWTLCIWRVERRMISKRQLESAIGRII
jgi:beta-lactamase regulating signal transducer with metallopeptidase domain